MQDQTIEDIEPEFGRWVRDKRREKGISQGELAHLSGGLVDASALSRIESGKRSVRLSEAVALAKALETPLLSPQFTERVDPVRVLVTDVLNAYQEADRAEAHMRVADNDAGIAADRAGQALHRLAELVPEVGRMTSDKQALILHALQDLRRYGGYRGALAGELLESAEQEVRAANQGKV